MKTTITATLLSILTFNIYAQDTPIKIAEEPLIIQSSQGRIQINNPSECTQYRTGTGSIAINCKNQCIQTTDSKDGKILIQC